MHFWRPTKNAARWRVVAREGVHKKRGILPPLFRLSGALFKEKGLTFFHVEKRIHRAGAIASFGGIHPAISPRSAAGEKVRLAAG